MKKTYVLLIGVIIVSSVSLLFSYLALHDISRDYVSERVLISENITDSPEVLPEWIHCPIEWSLVEIDLFIRVIMLVALVIIARKLFREKQ